MTRAEIKLEKADWDGAIADYNQAITLDPKDTSSYNERGLAWYHKGEEALALADYNKALDLDAKNAHAYVNRGNIERLTGKLGAAMDDYNQALLE